MTKRQQWQMVIELCQKEIKECNIKIAIARRSIFEYQKEINKIDGIPINTQRG